MNTLYIRIFVILNLFFLHNYSLAEDHSNSDKIKYIILDFKNFESQTLDEIIKAINANIVFMRHEKAPGTGDPDNFSKFDCSTQRNLSQEGRQLSKQTGHLFKQSDLNFNKILSSEWCRSYDTAVLLDNIKVEKFSGLNTFYQGFVDKKETLLVLNNLMKKISLKQIYLMVTHQDIITAITGLPVGSGELILFNYPKGVLLPLTKEQMGKLAKSKT